MLYMMGKALDLKEPLNELILGDDDDDDDDDDGILGTK